jgi:hypothetical protein
MPASRKQHSRANSVKLLLHSCDAGFLSQWLLRMPASRNNAAESTWWTLLPQHCRASLVIFGRKSLFAGPLPNTYAECLRKQNRVSDERFTHTSRNTAHHADDDASQLLFYKFTKSSDWTFLLRGVCDA